MVETPLVFTWTRGNGAGTCPVPETMGRQIATSLGSQVLASDASRAIEAVATRTNGTWSVKIYERVKQEARFSEKSIAMHQIATPSRKQHRDLFDTMFRRETFWKGECCKA
jgi:hypothetical protein